MLYLLNKIFPPLLKNDFTEISNKVDSYLPSVMYFKIEVKLFLSVIKYKL